MNFNKPYVIYIIFAVVITSFIIKKNVHDLLLTGKKQVIKQHT